MTSEPENKNPWWSYTIVMAFPTQRNIGIETPERVMN